MGIFEFLVNSYNTFLGLFPPPLQWLVTFVIVIGFIAAFVALIKHNVLAVIILILLLPLFIPVLQHFFADIYAFFLYLLQTLRGSVPQP